VTQADVPSAAVGDGPPDRTDGESRLLDGLRRGDPAAANELVERYAARAYRLAIAITRNADDAEEAVQDALWSAIRNIDTFRGEAALGSWLYRIVTNSACQKLRRTAHRRAEISLDEMLPRFHEDDWSGRLDDPAIRSRVRATLNAAIDDLPPDYRAVVLLRDVEGLTLAEAATSMGITVANAKSRLHRARLFLRKRLASVIADAA
jgi:RNA polymerase sigma-70 factor, ECF subfamily